MRPIYAIGNAGMAQASMREDGQWFRRDKHPRTYLWGKWMEIKQRPEGAWYDPRLGHAKLPEKEKE